MEDKFDLSTFVNSCGMTLTGADLYALCSDAMLNAMKRNIEQYEAGMSMVMLTLLMPSMVVYLIN